MKKLIVSTLIATVSALTFVSSAFAGGGWGVGGGYVSMASQQSQGSFSGYYADFSNFFRYTTMSSSTEKVTSMQVMLPPLAALGIFGAVAGAQVRDLNDNDMGFAIKFNRELGLAFLVGIGYGWRDNIATNATEGGFTLSAEPSIWYTPTDNILIKAGYNWSSSGFKSKSDQYSGIVVGAEYMF